MIRTFGDSKENIGKQEIHPETSTSVQDTIVPELKQENPSNPKRNKQKTTRLIYSGANANITLKLKAESY